MFTIGMNGSSDPREAALPPIPYPLPESGILKIDVKDRGVCPGIVTAGVLAVLVVWPPIEGHAHEPIA